jgi:MOSC domain-containing protein YiiM
VTVVDDGGGNGVAGTVEAVEVVGVFVGRPRVVGERRGRPVSSAIGKQPVAVPTLALAPTNLAGDQQADLTVHGGPDKAVYLYPSEHYAGWQRDGFDLAVGGVGENVALRGADEHQVRLGDVWRWGEALIQPSQPRSPCFKLTLHTGRRDVGPRMIATRRCGWYARVLQPGDVPTGGALVLEDRLEGAPTIHDLYTVRFGSGTADEETLERVLASPALSESWRGDLTARAARRSRTR